MYINREPALALALVASAVQLVSAFFFPLSDAQQGTINALASAIAGVCVAVWVTHEALAPLVLGLLQAAMALGLAFGLNLSGEQQSVIMSFAAAAVAMFTRQIVTARVDAHGVRR